jgi:ribose transport system permease protein
MNSLDTTGDGVDRTPLEALRGWAERALSQAAAAGALIAVFIFLSIASPVFLTTNNLFNVGVQTSETAILAIGMTFVIVTAGIDLSVGALAALAGVFGAQLISQTGLPPAVAVVLAVMIGGAIGAINGWLIAYGRLAPFIATLGMMSVARGVVYLTTDATAVSVPNSFSWLGSGEVLGLPVPLLFLAVFAVAGHLLLSRTKFGRYLYAIGSNVHAARLSGIAVKRYTGTVYVISGACAGFGGMIAVSRTVSAQPNYGLGLELDVIAAAVVGGASLFGGQGTVIGTLIGAFLIALIRNGAVLLDVNTYWQAVILGLLIWAGVSFDQYRRRRLANATEHN